MRNLAVKKWIRVVVLAGSLAIVGAACDDTGAAPADDPAAPADDPLAPGGTETP